MGSRATWADRYRSGHPETAPWHYVDIDFDRPDLKAACLDRQCLPAKISQIERVLAKPAYPPQTRAGALIWLLHLVDDVHQPLHTIDRQVRGGNCEAIETPHGLESLHKWWDDDVVNAIRGPRPRAAWLSPGEAGGAGGVIARDSRQLGGSELPDLQDRDVRLQLGPVLQASA